MFHRQMMEQVWASAHPSRGVPSAIQLLDHFLAHGPPVAVMSRHQRQIFIERFFFRQISSGTRVKFSMNFVQFCPADMGVNLGGRNARMTQQLLNDPQIRPMIQQMGRE